MSSTSHPRPRLLRRKFRLRASEEAGSCTTGVRMVKSKLQHVAVAGSRGKVGHCPQFNLVGVDSGRAIARLEIRAGLNGVFCRGQAYIRSGGQHQTYRRRLERPLSTQVQFSPVVPLARPARVCGRSRIARVVTDGPPGVAGAIVTGRQNPLAQRVEMARFVSFRDSQQCCGA